MKDKKSMTKRLFLFAGYDAGGIIDASMIYYIHSLSKLGDIIFVMDSDIKRNELNKIKKYCLYSVATRHNEYDFGSYKRAFVWAHKNLDLKKYDYMYMVNDSVYGPLYDIDNYLKEMESWGTDAFGLIKNPKKTHPHIQSWFIGMHKKVFNTKWFYKFIIDVKHQKSKGLITSLYEHGFTKNLILNNNTWRCMYSVPGRGIYNKIKKLYEQKMPFIKKAAFTRHDGALGQKIKYILAHIPKNLSDAIIENACRVYGKEYITGILNRNALSCFVHNIKYGFKKLITGKL